MKTKILIPILMLLLILGNVNVAGAQSPSGTLSVSNGAALPSGSDSIQITLTSVDGAQISGVSFNLTYDSNRLSVNNVSAGSAATSAEKSVNSQVHSNYISILVVGINSNVIPNGTIVNVEFNVLAGAPSGTSALAITGDAASDPNGQEVPLNISNGTFIVESPPVPTNTTVPSDTPVPANTNTPTRTSQPPPLSSPTKTRTATATQSSSGAATYTPTHTSPTPILPSPTGSQTKVATEDLTVTTVASENGSNSTSNQEAVSKEMAESIEMAILATITALAEVDSQVAATGTALALSSSGSPSTKDDESAGDQVNSDLLIGIAILGVSVAVVTAAVAGVRAIRKRRSMSNSGPDSANSDASHSDDQDG
jgi:hypothetical protein